MAMLSRSPDEAYRLHSCIRLAKLSEGMVASDEKFNMPCQCTDHMQIQWPFFEEGVLLTRNSRKVPGIPSYLPVYGFQSNGKDYVSNLILYERSRPI